MKPKTKKVEKRKTKKEKTDMLRSIDKQSGESVESVLLIEALKHCTAATHCLQY